MGSNVIAGPGEYQTHEREAAADVEMGHLVEYAADGRVQPHSTAGGPGFTAFAIPFRSLGQTVDHTATYDADNDEGERVKYAFPSPGTKVPGARLAAGESVTDGDPLVSAGDGTLQAAAGDGTEDAAIVAYANESTDNSGGAEAVRHEVISA
ncbi:hypothetical protein [Halalkalicoccus sp. NIPERK01]|uniref:hypothetical protein n=1 Tax=Halalkalicoccus sp. NIPERK01 TaxID=3053469 RepID=UPI00256EE12E|nr:hypothetical protein [Halalkalicoccus sp. NIPERK01]MDL5361358.1 hypothetical protein [Halalkalicoccus sp. NIPERK01]